jgi:hypothetical protein
MLAFGGCASSLNTGAASIGGTLAQGANPKQFRDEAERQDLEPTGTPLALHESRKLPTASLAKSPRAAATGSPRQHAADEEAESSANDDAALRRKLVICSGCQTKSALRKKPETVDPAALSSEDER